MCALWGFILAASRCKSQGSTQISSAKHQQWKDTRPKLLLCFCACCFQQYSSCEEARMADIQRLLDSMAKTPDIYFCDAWQDALMGDVLRYLVTKMSGCWSPAADRVISICCHGQSLPLKRLRQTLLDRLASGTFFFRSLWTSVRIYNFFDDFGWPWTTRIVA